MRNGSRVQSRYSGMRNSKRSEIRFPGFTVEWNQCKLEDVADRMKSYSLSRDVETADDTGYKYIHYGDIHTKVADIIDENSELPNIKVGNYELLQKNDVVVADASEDYQGIATPAVVTYTPEFNLVSGLHTIALRPKKTVAIYLYYLLNTQIFKKYGYKVGTGMKVFGISSTNLMKFEASYPSLDEQEQIGNFLKQLDDTIALYQNELDVLKKTKKGFLQKMFPKEGESVPEVRFPGFTDDWEQRKLGEITLRVTRKNKELKSALPLTISAQEGLIDQNEFFNKTVASHDVSGYYLVKNGEFAYNKSYSNGYPWGAVKRLDKYDMGVLSTLYIVFKPTDVNSDFLAKYYDTTYWYREVSKHAAEGARNHGLLNIAASDFFETKLSIPKSEEEQLQIGNFFKQLDDTIALHQRELESLKETKKAFLQKMFINS